jgi:L-iditol 2-dehydrogenase
VAACGICGSDLHAYRAAPGYEWVQPPVILGHEFAGTVVARGGAVRHIKEGDRAAVVGVQGCGRCRVCRSGDTNLCRERKVLGLHADGGMAACAVVAAACLVPLPTWLDPIMGALVEPISVAAHAMAKTVIRPGDRVVVSGPGPIGLFCGCIAASSGARVVMVGTAADALARLPLARRLGLCAVNAASDTLDSAFAQAFEGTPPDVWVEASGAPQAFVAAVDRVRRGGRLVIVGVYAQSFEWMPTAAVRAGHSMFFSYGSATRDYDTALDVIAAGGIDPAPFVSRFALEKAAAAFEQVMAGRAVKTVLVPGQSI